VIQEEEISAAMPFFSEEAKKKLIEANRRGQDPTQCPEATEDIYIQGISDRLENIMNVQVTVEENNKNLIKKLSHRKEIIRTECDRVEHSKDHSLFIKYSTAPAGGSKTEIDEHDIKARENITESWLIAIEAPNFSNILSLHLMIDFWLFGKITEEASLKDVCAKCSFDITWEPLGDVSDEVRAHTLSKLEIIGITGLLHTMMGKAVQSRDQTHITTYITTRKRVFKRMLGIPDSDPIGDNDVFVEAAKMYETYPILRRWVFQWIHSHTKSNRVTGKVDSMVQTVVNYLRGSFMTYHVLIVDQILIAERTKFLDVGMRKELDALTAYLTLAKEKNDLDWMYNRLNILNTEVAPVSTRDIRVLANLALKIGLAAQPTLSNLQAPPISPEETQRVSKICELVGIYENNMSIQMQALNMQAMGAEKRVIDTAKRPVSSFDTGTLEGVSNQGTGNVGASQSTNPVHPTSNTWNAVRATTTATAQLFDQLRDQLSATDRQGTSTAHSVSSAQAQASERAS